MKKILLAILTLIASYSYAGASKIQEPVNNVVDGEYVMTIDKKAIDVENKIKSALSLSEGVKLEIERITSYAVKVSFTPPDPKYPNAEALKKALKDLGFVKSVEPNRIIRISN